TLTYRVFIIMKLVLAILIITMMQVHGKSSAQTINLKVRKTPLSRVMRSVQQQTGYAFFLNGKSMASSDVSVSLTGASLEETMDAILSPLALDWVLKDETIIVRSKPREKRYNMPFGLDQQQTIRGRVQDKDGRPIIGATVTIKGNQLTVTTDDNGLFEIVSTVQDPVLMFSYVGYQNIELPWNNEQDMSVTLQQLISDLEEVVIVGYASQQRANVIGSVATVNA